MLTMNNVPTQDGYTEATTLGPVAQAEQVVYVVANNPVIAQLAGTSKAGTTQPWGPEILITPNAGTFSRLQGIRFKSAIPGSPAQVVAQLVEPGDPVPSAGTPFTAFLSTSGQVSPVASGAIIEVGFHFANVQAVGNNFAGGNDLLSPVPLTFDADGVSSYLVRVAASSWQLNNAVHSAEANINLDGVDNGQIGQMVSQVANVGQNLMAEGAILTPAQGPHTVNIRVWPITAGDTLTVIGGPGGPGQRDPIIVTVVALP